MATIVLFMVICIASLVAGQNPIMRPVMEQNLTVPGPEITASSLELTFPPGDQGIPPHFHSGPVFGYVIEGVYLYQIEGRGHEILTVGEGFFEYDRDVHMWGANASNETVCKVFATIYGRVGEPVRTILDDKWREDYQTALRLARERN